MSPLTPDERAAAVGFLRAIETGVGGERLSAVLRAKARELADRLEAEPEPSGLDLTSPEANVLLRVYEAAGPVLSNAAVVVAVPILAKVVNYIEGRTAEHDEDAEALRERARVAFEVEPPAYVPARERDEAREALRDLLAAVEAERNDHGLSEAMRHVRRETRRAAEHRARAVLEGVERTHTLVPVAALRIIEDRLEDYVGDQLSDGASGQTVQTSMAVLNAVSATLRGEHVEWPS